MAVFAVALTQKNDAVKERIKDLYPNNYQLSSTLFFLTSSELTHEIATKIGIRDEPRVPRGNGVVLRFNAYAGYTNKALWEWMAVQEEGS